MTWYDKGSWNCSLVGWAVKLAGCLSKQQLSNQAPTKAARANNEHFQIPWPLMAFQTIFDSNVLWTDLVTLWRNCALSSFHNFECVYCSKKREGSLEAAAPRERERERECIQHRRSYYVVCFAMISSLQLISSSVSKAAATYKRAAARSSYCAQLLSFSRIFSWKSSLPNNFKLLDYILNYYIMDNTVTNP